MYCTYTYIMWFDVRSCRLALHYEYIPLHPFRFASHSKTIVKQKGEWNVNNMLYFCMNVCSISNEGIKQSIHFTIQNIHSILTLLCKHFIYVRRGQVNYTFKLCHRRYVRYMRYMFNQVKTRVKVFSHNWGFI